MSNKNNDLAVEPVSRIPQNSTNTKALFIVVTEDPTVKTKHRFYITHRVDQNPQIAEILGYEVTDSTITQIKSAGSYNDAFELAKKENEVEHLMIPWQKILRIKKLSYSTTKQ